MGEYVLTLLAAAAVTYLLTPAVRRLAVAVGALHAARDRDVHVVPTPLLGGFAMYAGLAAGLLVASRIPGLTPAFAQPNMAKGLLLAGGLVVLMGFVDDRWGLSALSKLAGQVAAGVILVWSGAEVTWLPLPNKGALALTLDQQTAATILVVVVTINAVNFIDGLDGLAAGIVGIGAAAFFIYYYTLTHRLGLPDQTGPALASAVLVGICLGFLPHNFYPARIFMGDTGAMLLGLLLAYAPISSLASLDPASLTDPAAFQAGTVNRFGVYLPLLVPAAIMLIPYADLLMAVVRRTRAGTSVFAPDKKHLQHRLLAIGHSHRTSVLIMYLWAALFAGSVVWLSIIRTSLYVLIIVTGAAVLALALVSMPRLRPWARAAPRQDRDWASRGQEQVRAGPGQEPGWPDGGQESVPADREPEPARAPQWREPGWAAQKQESAWAERGQEPPRAVQEQQPPQTVQEPEPPWIVQEPEPPWIVQEPEPPWIVQEPEPPWIVQEPEPVRSLNSQERDGAGQRPEPGWAFAAPGEAARRAADVTSGNDDPSQDGHSWFTPRAKRPAAPARPVDPGEFLSAAEMGTASAPAADAEATNPIPAVPWPPPVRPTHRPPSAAPVEPAPWPGFGTEEQSTSARPGSAPSRSTPPGSTPPGPAPSRPAPSRSAPPDHW
jgi:UDP-GlcNAc:undecaprenyl-phosphate GlcNAc-1-phosphate transferase